MMKLPYRPTDATEEARLLGEIFGSHSCGTPFGYTSAARAGQMTQLEP